MAMNMDASLRLSAKVDGLNNIVSLNRGLQSVETTAKGVTGAMRGVAGAASGLSGALGTLAPLLSVAGLVGMVQNTIKAGDLMYDLSQRTGVAVESLAKFKKAASVSGTDIDVVAKAMNKLNKNIVDAATGNKEAAKGFALLRLSATNANGTLKTADQVMLEVADRFKGMNNDAVKARAAMALFGSRMGAELIPMLNMGGDAIDKLSIKMTTAFAIKADEYSDKIALLGGKVGALGADLTIALLPALQAVTDAVTSFVSAFNTLPDIAKTAAVAGASLAVAWGPLTGILRAASGGMALLGSSIAPVLEYISAVGVGLEGISVMATDAGFALASVPVAGWIAAAIAGLGALSVALYKNNQGFKSWADTSLNFIKVLASDGTSTMQRFGRNLASMWSGLVSIAQRVGGGIAQSFTGPFGVIANVARTVFSFVANQMIALWRMIPAPLRSVNEQGLKYIQGAWARASSMAAGASGAGGSKQAAVGSFAPDLGALASGGGNGGKSKKERDSELASIEAANGLYRSQESIKARIYVAEQDQNTSEKLRLEMIGRGVDLLAEAASIEREKLSTQVKAAKLQGVSDKLRASENQYTRELAAYIKQARESRSAYMSGLESLASGYSLSLIHI